MRRLIAALALALALTPLPGRAQQPPPLDILVPAGPAPSTAREVVHVLGRTTPGAQVRVGGEAVTVFATGVFARDRLPLAPGLNRIAVEVTAADGAVTQRVIEIERTPPPPEVAWPRDRLFLDGGSLRPAELQRLAPGETVEVAVRATPGQRVEARLPGGRWQALAEQAGAPGRYRARLRFEGGDDGDIAPAPVALRVTATTLASPRAASPRPRRAGPAARSLLTATPGAVGRWRADPERLWTVGAEGVEVLHGLHEVRLGGPFIADLPPGTLLHATGQRGEMLRVALAPDLAGWVPEKALTPAPPGTRAPSTHFTTVAVSGSEAGDVVAIPLTARVPYAVRAVSGSDGRQFLEIDVFGAHHATTWVTQRASARLVRELTVEPAGPQRVRLRVLPQARRLWGWQVERSATHLRVTLSPPPALAATGSPLAGLHIALEAGHGSADNLGAVGATGVPEKDINRWTTEALAAELQAAGARVLMVREGDDNPNLRERARRAQTGGAQLYVSVHANAAGSEGGHLRVAGTSTFHKHVTGRELAAAIQRRMLATGLDDFGLVGNFNYAPLRLLTGMPAVLVEQAFVSHPGDEARLLDPAFRAQMALAVRRGLEDFLDGVRRDP